MAIKITKWEFADECENYSHIRKSDSDKDIRGWSSAVADYSPEKVIEAGIALNLLRPDGDGWYHVVNDSGQLVDKSLVNCDQIREAVEEVLGVDDREVVNIRGQLIDIGFGADEVAILSDVEVAALDWLARQVVIEAAKSVESPWNGSCDVIRESCDAVVALASGYIERRRRNDS